MSDLLIGAYPWTKSAHVISMVAWMAGLFYLPRLFVYHVERGSGAGEPGTTLEIMETKLLRLIMTPAMVATWVLGLVLLATPGTVVWSADVWIWMKLAFVGLLTWFHHWCGRRRKELAAGTNRRDGRHYRLMNEVPTLALVAIVVLVLVKPF